MIPHPHPRRRLPGALVAVLGVVLGGCAAGHSHAAGVARAPSATAIRHIGGTTAMPPGARGTLPLAEPTQPAVPSAAADLAGADPTDATAVAEAFARASWSIDTATEPSEAAAEAQLAGLMTPSLSATVAAAARAIQPTAVFAAWSAHGVVTRVEVAQTHDPGAAPDTPTAAERSFAVVVTPIGDDGWTAAAITQIEFITLTRPGPGGPWRIAALA